MPCRQVPYPDQRIHRSSNDPPAVGREGEVIHLANAAPELTDELPRFNVDNTDGKVIAAECHEFTRVTVAKASNSSHGVPIELVNEPPGHEIPELNMTVSICTLRTKD
jgi:hypothetical protein